VKYSKSQYNELIWTFACSCADVIEGCCWR